MNPHIQYPTTETYANLEPFIFRAKFVAILNELKVDVTRYPHISLPTYPVRELVNVSGRGTNQLETVLI